MQTTITPVDNSVYIERNYDTNRIEDTIQGAVKAQKEWSNLTVQERVKLLKNFVEDFLSKGDLIAEELTKQIGRPISQAPGELRGFKERADYMLSIAEKNWQILMFLKMEILKVISNEDRLVLFL